MRVGILVLSLLLNASVCIAAMKPGIWKRVELGAGKAKITAVALDAELPQRVAIAAGQSVLESLDDGATWIERARLPQHATITTLALPASASSLLIGSTDGLYFSPAPDQGLQSVAAVRPSCTSLLVRPDNPKIVYAGTQDGLFMSPDSGVTWREVTIPQPARHIVDLVDGVEYADQLFLVTTHGLYVGRLQVGQWIQLQGGNRAGGPEVEEPDVVEPSETAEEPELLHPLGAIVIDPVSTALYMGGPTGLSRSTDGGQSWEPLPRAGMGARDIRHLLLKAHSPVVLYAVTSRGIARFDPGLLRWKSLTTGLTTRRINDLAGSSQALWAATDDGLFRYEVAPDLDAESGSPDAQELLANFTHEPTIAQVRDSAIRYAEVHPEKIRQWRRQAALKAFLPSLDFGYDRNRSNDVGVDEGSFPNFQFIETEDRDSNWDMSVSWDLSELIWNQDQTSIDVRSKLMVQLRNDVVDEVTRTYFERRRIQVELLTDPPSVQKALLAKELRVQELTALLDGLTDGYFSQYNQVPTKQ